MNALILAAGEGSRLGDLTTALPKPMLQIAGRPVLEYNVLLLARFDICDITINTHYQQERIVSHFGDGHKYGVNISYSYERELLGTAGALVPLRDAFLNTFVILFGDNLTNCNLADLIAFHHAKRAAATITLFHREDVRSSGVAEIESDSRIRRFVEKPATERMPSKWVNAGIVVSERVIFDYIPRDRPSDLGRDVFPAMLDKKQPIFGYCMSEELYWIDTPEDYERTKTTLSHTDLSRWR